MKKAQLLEQPLFYLFVLIVAALFLAWGIKSIFNLKERADLVELTTAVQDLKNKVESYYSFDYGSAAEINIRMPVKIKYICFTNHNPEETPLKQYGDLSKLFQLSKDNVFILPQTAFQQNSFIIDHLTSKPDPLCIQARGSLKALITNIGSSVEITI